MKKYIVSVILFSISFGSLSYGAILNNDSKTLDSCKGVRGPFFFYTHNDYNPFCAMSTTTTSIPTIIVEDKEINMDSPDIQVRLVSEAADLSNSESNNNAGEQVLISAIAEKLQTSKEEVANAVLAIHAVDEKQIITLEDIKAKISSSENNQDEIAE